MPKNSFMEKYISNPDLPLINRNFKGNLMKDGRFSNHPWPDTDASLKNVLKWFLTPNPQRQEKKEDTFRLKVIRNEKIFERKENGIVWLGHSAFFLRLDGKSLLFDPVLFSLPLIKRLAELPCAADKIKNIDYLLLSHGHRDHFDNKSLETVLRQNPRAIVLCPLKIGSLVRKLDRDRTIQEAGWYQEFRTGGVKITMLPALHWHRRYTGDFNEMLWGSFMVEGRDQKIFFAGDTAYGSHFSEIRSVTGAPDICLLPIGAYKPPFLMQASHMNPQEAVRSFTDLGGKQFIPMHYGTYDLANEPIGEPIRMVRKDLSADKLKELAVGEFMGI